MAKVTFPEQDVGEVPALKIGQLWVEEGELMEVFHFRDGWVLMNLESGFSRFICPDKAGLWDFMKDTCTYLSEPVTLENEG